jgi:protein-S-isoprenylcysteine O-methyltransferase Ste14
MKEFRYGLALLVVVSSPGAVGAWLLIHGFRRGWRRVGPRIAYSVLVLWTLTSWVVLYHVREPLLRVEFGTRPDLALLGLALYGVAAGLEVLCWKHLTLRTLIGLPELLPASGEAALLREGVYARMRHPRYTAWILGLAAVALVCNYLATYVLALLFVPAIFFITVLEERELLERFGAAYARYQAEVPRFVPRLGHRQLPGSPQGPPGSAR